MKKIFCVLLLLQVTAGCFCQIITIRKQYYIIYFHEKQKAPLYTVYTLKKTFIINNNKRHGSFQQDTSVPLTEQANAAVYKNNDYDQGHLTPDADFRFNDTAEKQTFLYTNAAPQESYFNEHLWANVEAHVRTICKTYGDVKVYTGCLYSAQKLHGIGIPAYFWKVILYKANGKSIQEAYKAKNIKPISNNYTVAADSIEDIKKLTGLVFSF